MSKSKRLMSDEEFEVARFTHGKQIIDMLVKGRPGDPLAPDCRAGEPTTRIDGWNRRWNQAMIEIEVAMAHIQAEMEAYHDQRSKQWRKGANAYLLIQRLGELYGTRDAVSAWIELPCVFHASNRHETPGECGRECAAHECDDCVTLHESEGKYGLDQ